MSSQDKASPGERFKAPSASVWNNIIDASLAYQNRAAADQQAPIQQARPTDLIKVRNDSCGPRRGGEVLKICGAAITTVTDEHKWLAGATTDAEGCFAILKQPLAGGGIGPAQVSGVCMAWVQVNNEGHNRARLIDGQVVLRSATTGQCEILYKEPGIGERFCVVRIVQSCVDQDEAEPDEPRTTNCTGNCQWTWTSGDWVLADNGCSPTTTTGEGTTTTVEPTTTTTGESTSADQCPCPASTTTTTTADHCQCLKPIFCAANEGECTFTSCSKDTNELPDCGPTTTTTTTTGAPCDCNTSTTPSGDGNCRWYRDPNGVLQCIDCPDGCLEPPISLDNCEVFVSPPVPPPTVPPIPACSGSCSGGTVWYCIPAFGAWFPDAGSTCRNRCREANDGRCVSPPPTLPCIECGSVFEPCVFVPFDSGTTTTTGEPTTTTTSIYDTTCGICYGSTTTSTTTTGSCEGTCRLKWSEFDIWQFQSKTCATECGCAVPGISGELPCHVIEVPCVAPTTTTTSTTTTTPEPTTTTTTSTTTTTTTTTSTTTSTSTTSTTTSCPPCEVPAGLVVWRCEGGVYFVFNNAADFNCTPGYFDQQGEPCIEECACANCNDTSTS